MRLKDVPFSMLMPNYWINKHTPDWESPILPPVLVKNLQSLLEPLLRHSKDTGRRFDVALARHMTYFYW